MRARGNTNCGSADMTISVGVCLSPFALQLGQNECGLACLEMLFDWYRLPFRESQARRLLSPSNRGSTLQDMISVAGALGLRLAGVACHTAEIASLGRPVILHWKPYHFVVDFGYIDPGKASRHIHDPGYGCREVRIGEVSEYFTGYMLAPLE